MTRVGRCYASCCSAGRAPRPRWPVGAIVILALGDSRLSRHARASLLPRLLNCLPLARCTLLLIYSPTRSVAYFFNIRNRILTVFNRLYGNCFGSNITSTFTYLLKKLPSRLLLGASTHASSLNTLRSFFMISLSLAFLTISRIFRCSSEPRGKMTDSS